VEEKVRSSGYLKLTKTSKSHIPELIRREIDVQPSEKIPFAICAGIVLLYDPKFSADDIIASLEVMKAHINLRRR